VLSRDLPAALLVTLVALGTLTACSSDDGSGTSVMDVEVGQCFLAQGDVKAQISDIEQVKCSQKHAQEAYATPSYQATADDTTSDAYPGDEALDQFAEGACAQDFGPYVGVDYLDSSLFFTYLAPSARSWQDGDRTVLCFVTSAGRSLVGSVKGKGI
jgi:hypothetical protein